MRRISFGFTLIELLIVVAIIGILAAIAIPNFLSAQVRAKVARAESDMRALAVANEMYVVDHNTYMRDGWGYPMGTFTTGTDRENHIMIWSQLTTPVEYAASIPADPFFVQGLRTAYGPGGVSYNIYEDSQGLYRYYTTDGWGVSAGVTNDNLFLGKWAMVSPGPDKVHNFGEWALYKPEVENSGHIRRYDPTNGTISFGDLIRIGP